MTIPTITRLPTMHERREFAERNADRSVQFIILALVAAAFLLAVSC